MSDSYTISVCEALAVQHNGLTEATKTAEAVPGRKSLFSTAWQGHG